MGVWRPIALIPLVLLVVTTWYYCDQKAMLRKVLAQGHIKGLTWALTLFSPHNPLVSASLKECMLFLQKNLQVTLFKINITIFGIIWMTSDQSRLCS